MSTTRPPLRIPYGVADFANQILAHEGQEQYRELTHGVGFFRHFFAELKGATGQTGSG